MAELPICKRCGHPIGSQNIYGGYCKDCSSIVISIDRAIVELQKKMLTSDDPLEKNRLRNQIIMQQKRKEKA